MQCNLSLENNQCKLKFLYFSSVQFNHLFSDFARSKAPLNAPVRGKRLSTRQDVCGKASQVSAVVYTLQITCTVSI